MARIKRPVLQRAGRFSVCCILLAVSDVATYSAWSAPAAKPRIQVPGKIVLDRVTVQDILVGPSAQGVGSITDVLTVQGTVLSATLTAPDAFTVNPLIVRRVNALWTIKFKKDDPKPLGFDVSYTLQSPLGVPDTLGSRTDPSITVAARVRDLGTQIATKPQGQMNVHGDAEFTFESTTLETPGRYAGDLVITVNFL